MKMEVELGGFLSQNETYDYDEDYEYKGDGDAEVSRAVLVPLLYSVVLALGLLGNVLLLVLLLRKRKSWSLSDTFVLHLSLADLLLLATLPFRAAQAAHHGLWFSGSALCKITGAVFHINFYCGIFLLTCIVVDRYRSIVHATRLFSTEKPFRAHLACLAVWLLSLMLTIPDWMYLMAVKDAETESEHCVHVYARSGADRRLTSRLFHHILGFLLPSVVLVYCLARILLRPRQKAKLPTSVAILLPLAGVFFLCWSPYNITLIVDAPRSSSPQDASAVKTALVATAILACVHACLRPLLYFFLCGNFRKRALALLKCASKEPKKWLWELGVGEEAAPDQTPEREGLKQIAIVDHQVQTPQC